MADFEHVIVGWKRPWMFFGFAKLLKTFLNIIPTNLHAFINDIIH